MPLLAARPTASHSPATAVPGASVRGDALRVCSALNEEWARLRQPATGPDSPDAQVASWGRKELLGTRAEGVSSVCELETVCRGCSGADNDAVLLQLIGLFHGGDQFAGRFVLQLFLGKIVRLVMQAAPRQRRAPEEAEAATLEAFWSVLRAYPIARRPRSVAANLSLDTLHRIRRRDDESEQNVDWALWRQEMALEGQQDRTAQVLLLIRDGLTAGVISNDEAQLLALTYAPASAPRTGAELAEELGLKDATVRARTSRAVARLAAFAHQQMSQPHDAPDSDPGTDAGICGHAGSPTSGPATPGSDSPTSEPQRRRKSTRSIPAPLRATWRAPSWVGHEELHDLMDAALIH